MAFERRAGDYLDEADPPPEIREAARAHLNALAETLPVLATTEADLAEATRLARQTADRLRGAPWYGTLIDTWPAPVAHEVEQFVATLVGRDRPAPEASLLQLRDVTETLAKLPAAVLASMSLQRGGPDADWVRHALAEVVGGKWLEFGRDAAQRLLAAEPGSRLAPLAGLLQNTPFSRGINDLVVARNSFLGHGAMRPNPAETAAIVAWFAARQPGDKAPDLDMQIPPTPLAGALAHAVAAHPWDGLRLQAMDGDTEIDLTGAAALRRWHGDPRHAEHQDRTLPVYLAREGEAKLPLAPFLAARICRKCGRRDVFFFDSIHDTRRLRADFLDYGRGHKSRLDGAAAPDMREALQDIALPPPAEGDTFRNRSAIERLDRLRVDRRYRSPEYLRKALRDFMATADRGVFWLQAPAHIGKTTFVQGLALTELNETPLVEGLHPGRGGGVVAFFCRRDYRDGRYTFLQSLAETIVEAINLTAVNERFPVPDDVLKASDGVRPAMGRWLAEWRRLAGWGARPLLLVVDGLDESDRGRVGDSLLDLLPRAGDLPANTWLLLTSRPVVAAEPDDATPWLGAALLPVMQAGGAVTLPVRLDDERHLALLRDYAAEALRAPERPAPAALVQALIGQSGGRFNLLAFLVEQHRGGSATEAELAALGQGPAIFDRFIQGLDGRFGEKRGHGLRQVLATLAAAEQAHAWAFDEGRVKDLATGGDLEPMARVFQGLDLSVLAAAVEMDEPNDDRSRGFGPAFVEALTLLQGVLWVWRGVTGLPRYRLGLRAFAERFAVLQPEAVAQAHAALVGQCLDAAEALNEAFVAKGWPTSFDVTTFRDLFPLLRGNAALAHNDAVAGRYREVPATSAAINLEARDIQAIPSLRQVRWYSAVAVALQDETTGLRTTTAFDNGVAVAYANRGNAKQFAPGFGPGAAKADYDAAIALGEALHDAMGEGWPPEWRNNLANAYMNRGVAKQDDPGFGPDAAMVDLDVAIALREALRDDQGVGWLSAWHNDLAGTYVNRGTAKEDATNFGHNAAIADYDTAIALREALRDALGDDWPLPWREGLANAYMNRGNAKRSAAGFGPTAAIADYDTAIALREAIRDTLCERWPPLWRNGLAIAYVNRGNAKNSTPAVGPLMALADYDAAIILMEALRDALSEEYPLPCRNALANAYMNRGNAKQSASGFRPGEEMADYDAAIALMEALRDTLGEGLPIKWRNDLVNAYMNLGLPSISRQSRSALREAPARLFLVFFDRDKVEITPTALKIVAIAAQNATLVASARVEVSGHAERTGHPWREMSLSHERADNVAAELIRLGVPKNVIAVQAFGSTRLAVQTTIRDAHNRRVEIILK